MSVLSPPRHPFVASALTVARPWCAGHRIDGAPALAHAVRVALALDGYAPGASPALLAAVLLHDAPELAPAVYAAAIRDALGPAVLRIVEELAVEHADLGRYPDRPDLARARVEGLLGDVDVLHATVADKIVSLRYVLTLADQATDPAAFWAIRRPLRALLPYLRELHVAATACLPAGMSAELARLLVRIPNTTAHKPEEGM